MAPGVIHHLRNLGFGHFMAEHTYNGETLFMHSQHDFKGLRMIEAKEPLQHDDDEFHRRVVVIEQQHLVARRPLRPRAGLGQNTKVALVIRIVRHHHGVL